MRAGGTVAIKKGQIARKQVSQVAATPGSTAARSVPYLAVTGLAIVLVSFITYASLSATVADYYSNTKLVRDGAEPGSAVLEQLRTIETTRAWVVPLTFVGLALLLTAIAASLVGITGALRARAQAFEEAVPKIRKRS